MIVNNYYQLCEWVTEKNPINFQHSLGQTHRTAYDSFSNGIKKFKETWRTGQIT